MFFDPSPMAPSFGGGPASRCCSCNQPIGTGQPTVELSFEPEAGHGLDELNGPYHAECATPYLSLKRAFDVLGRGWG